PAPTRWTPSAWRSTRRSRSSSLDRTARRRMNALLRAGYEGAALLARALAELAPASGNKLLRTFAARRGVRARYAAFARRRARPLLWMHAPSVGEGLQARPVLELARSRMPDAQLAYTYFSPSAARFADALDVDFR